MAIVTAVTAVTAVAAVTDEMLKLKAAGRWPRGRGDAVVVSRR